ncbi:hypothetical protein SAMN04488700_2276 [Carnobacterium iners]|uniref:Uncharacterized protein n=1 Tax=Carnobacterium iners TaxID=1073423 RepID=A0A1X7NQ61_9LACT|nr:hypothetical protein [Carnobacterium iners]SEK29521.1 hypothetical protein SAMN04488114_10298 [Carnobacterium iners]SMH39752.1 hypothetical protein SAMN04488700_2276 [Carnobacterium iners]
MISEMDSSQITENIEKLISGKTDEIFIKKEDFMIFREIWLNHPKKNSLIGTANHYGEVSYQYKSID